MKIISVKFYCSCYDENNLKSMTSATLSLDNVDHSMTSE